jgi:hypothetical protein
MGIWTLLTSLGPPYVPLDRCFSYRESADRLLLFPFSRLPSSILFCLCSSAPFFTGFSQYHTGTWRWTMWSLAIIQGVQFIIAFFTLTETIFVRPVRDEAPAAGDSKPLDTVAQPEPPRSYWSGLLSFHRRSTRSWALVLVETIRPLSLFARPEIFLPVLGYSVLFSYSNVLLTVEIPSASLSFLSFFLLLAFLPF